MKTYQVTGKPNELWFTNYDRLDEEILFQQIKERLMAIPDVVIGAKKIGPSEDFYECSFAKKPFQLCFDLDYGTSIYAQDTAVLDKLTKYFN